MAKGKLVRCEIYWRKDRWIFRYNGHSGIDYGSKMTKVGLIDLAIRGLTSRVAAGEYGFTLRIKKKDGTYQNEITIPRSADPKRSKG